MLRLLRVRGFWLRVEEDCEVLIDALAKLGLLLLCFWLSYKVREADFVVLMWDTDLNHIQVTLEWGFLADLLSQPLKLVDELYIELHFAYKSISGYTWEGFVQKVSASSTSSLGGPDSPTSLDRK